jgi:hypothetical protein
MASEIAGPFDLTCPACLTWERAQVAHFLDLRHKDPAEWDEARRLLERIGDCALEEVQGHTGDTGCALNAEHQRSHRVPGFRSGRLFRGDMHPSRHVEEPPERPDWFWEEWVRRPPKGGSADGAGT